MGTNLMSWDVQTASAAMRAPSLQEDNASGNSTLPLSPTLIPRDKKIVIVSNNYLSAPAQEQICVSHEERIRRGSATPTPGQQNAINVVMVNLQNTAPTDYIDCLVGYDATRIYEEPTVRFYPELQQLVGVCRDEICSAPTPSPTTDPTNFPSWEPTVSPTDDPSVNPTTVPSNDPTTDPSTVPTELPTFMPSVNPTTVPTDDPTLVPTFFPTPQPTKRPTKAPTPRPTRWPTKAPTPRPTEWPTRKPTYRPTH